MHVGLRILNALKVHLLQEVRFYEVVSKRERLVVNLGG